MICCADWWAHGTEIASRVPWRSFWIKSERTLGILADLGAKIMQVVWDWFHELHPEHSLSKQPCKKGKKLPKSSTHCSWCWGEERVDTSELASLGLASPRLEYTCGSSEKSVAEALKINQMFSPPWSLSLKPWTHTKKLFQVHENIWTSLLASWNCWFQDPILILSEPQKWRAWVQCDTVGGSALKAWEPFEALLRPQKVEMKGPDDKNSQKVEPFEWPKGCHSVCLYLIENTLEPHPSNDKLLHFTVHTAYCTAAGHMPTSCCWTWHRRLSARCGLPKLACANVPCDLRARCISCSGGDSDCGWWSAFSLSGQHADHWPGQCQRFQCGFDFKDWFERKMICPAISK